MNDAKVRNITNNKGREVPNQFIIEDSEYRTFQSYKSTIAVYDKYENTLKVFSNWDYSKTTLKYFKQFINECTCFKYENKAQWIKEMTENGSIKRVI